MISQILATDMAFHGEICSKIKTKIKTRQSQERFIFLSGNDKMKFDEQQSLLNYLIHLADLGHNCKRFDISFSWVKLLCEEFWDQGDKEKNLHLKCSCDREKVSIYQSQLGFINYIELPFFSLFEQLFPKLKFYSEQLSKNKNILISMEEEEKKKKEEK